MSDPFFDFFNENPPATDFSQWPLWGKLDFKTYPYSERIRLPEPGNLDPVTLKTAFIKRKTTREFADRPISKATLGMLLFWSGGLIHGLFSKSGDGMALEKTMSDKKEALRRPYPSGGALFPLEIYVALFKDESGENGVFHYNLKEHSLENLPEFSLEFAKKSLYYDFARDAGAIIFLYFSGKNTLNKYGAFGYKLGLIEAGHLGQNFYLVAAALGLGVSALGGVEPELFKQAIPMEENESLVYHLAVGWPLGCG